MTADQALDKLSLVTLAIEAAIHEDQLDQLTPLMAERLKCIETLEAAAFQPEWSSKFEALRHIEDRILGRLAEIRTLAAQSMASESRRREGVRKFQTSHAPPAAGQSYV